MCSARLCSLFATHHALPALARCPVDVSVSACASVSAAVADGSLLLRLLHLLFCFVLLGLEGYIGGEGYFGDFFLGFLFYGEMDNLTIFYLLKQKYYLIFLWIYFTNRIYFIKSGELLEFLRVSELILNFYDTQNAFFFYKILL